LSDSPTVWNRPTRYVPGGSKKTFHLAEKLLGEKIDLQKKRCATDQPSNGRDSDHGPQNPCHCPVELIGI